MVAEYVEQLIDTVEQFFADYPGYYAIFMPLQGSMPELEVIDAAADAQLMQDLAMFLSVRYPNLELEVYKAITRTAFTALMLSSIK